MTLKLPNYSIPTLLGVTEPISRSHGIPQPSYMTDAEFTHYHLVRNNPRYWASRHFYPVVLSESASRQEAMRWLEDRGIQRGDGKSAHDWLHPSGTLFLIREEAVAVEFALRWAGE